MSIITGLADIIKRDEEMEKARAERENKVAWLSSIWSKNADPEVKIKAGTKVDVIPLQELDTSSERYSEKNGLGFFAIEHNNPSKGEFWKRCLCTNNEENDFTCWGCEKNRLEWSKKSDDYDYKGGWKAKTNLYLNVLARYTNSKGDEVEGVFVLQKNRSPRGNYVDDILEYAIEDGFISNRVFHMSRKGEGFDTVYRFIPKDTDAGVNVEDYDVFGRDSLVREVDYEEQAKALGASVAPKRIDITDDETNPEDDDTDWL